MVLDVLIQILSVLCSLLLLGFYIIYISYKLLSGMDSDSPRYIKRTIKPNSIDVHPSKKSLVINCVCEVEVLDDKGNILCEQKQNFDRVINLASLSARSDCSSYAKEVIERCDLIHPSRLSEVEQLIYYLKNRKVTLDADSPRVHSALSGKDSPTDSAKTELANINKVEDYIELLYEDISDKIRGSALILQLARDPANLKVLTKNETVLSALARVLREDWKRSIVLSTNLIYTFFCFSTYSDFHSIILSHKIGSLCMDVIDYELKRYDEWKEDLDGEKSSESKERKTCPTSASMTEIPRTKIPERIRPKSGNWSESMVASTSMGGSIYDDLSSSTDNIESRRQLTQADKVKRYRTLIKKQEQLLRVAFYLLLNIAEDESVEEKMANRNIVEMLIKTLERTNEDLLILVVTFLKKLSIYETNKDSMTEHNVIEKMPKLLQSDNPDLVHLSLKLLFNLSFSKPLREKMVKVGLLSKFVSLLSDDRHQGVIMKLLYHLSYEDKVKSMFAYTDSVSLLTDMVLLCKEQKVDVVLISLLVNLALNESNAQQMIENNRLQSMMARAFKYQDVFLIKMIRNVSQHKSTHEYFVDFIGDIAQVLTQCKNEEFLVECAGIFGNIWIPDIDYAQIFKHFALVPWFRKVLVPGAITDDIVLEAIIIIGTAARDEGCAQLFCKSELLVSLVELLKAKQEDDEIVLQIIYAFYQILKHESTRNYVIIETEAPGYFIDLLHDEHKEILKFCNACLDIISESNSEWAERIKIEKFRIHNEKWLTMIESHEATEADYENVLEELPPYLNTEFLTNAVVPTLADLEIEDISVNENYSDRPSSRYIRDLEMELI